MTWSLDYLSLCIGAVLGILFMWGVGEWAASIVRREGGKR